MDSFAPLVTLAGIWALVVVSPGPDFVVTAHHATAHSRSRALWVAAGITAGTFAWAAASMAGLAVLFANAGWLVHVVRVVGAIYLVYLGVRLLCSSFSAARLIAFCRTAKTTAKVSPDEGAGSGYSRQIAARTSRTPLQAFRLGLLTDLANPKAAVFWSSLLSLTLPAHPSLAMRLAVLFVATTIAAAWYAGVALFFSLGAIARGYAKARTWIDRVTGTVMVGLGVRLGIES